MTMKPNTKIKFSERFAAKVDDISSNNLNPEKNPSFGLVNNEPSQNFGAHTDSQQNDAMLSYTDLEMLQLISRTKNVKTLDEATLLQIELQSMMLMTLKAMDWKLWEIYNLTKGK